MEKNVAIRQQPEIVAVGIVPVTRTDTVHPR